MHATKKKEVSPPKYGKYDLAMVLRCFMPKNLVADLNACRCAGATWGETFRGGVGCALGLVKSCLAFNIWANF